MKEFMELLVRSLVDNPDLVEVEQVDDELHLWVDPNDRGAVIGRRGKTIRALRDLLRAHGDQHKHRTQLVLIEDEDDEEDDAEEEFADTEGAEAPFEEDDVVDAGDEESE